MTEKSRCELPQKNYYQPRPKRPKKKHVCEWCHEEFFNNNYTVRFCRVEHRQEFSKMRKRIYNSFPFEYEKSRAEEAKLKVQGVNYRLPEGES
jgi:hypothetical protein